MFETHYYSLGVIVGLVAAVYAYTLFLRDAYAQYQQRRYFRDLYEQSYRVKVDMKSIAHELEIYMPKRDPTTVLALFYDEAGGIHIVWTDEVFTADKEVDKRYRRYRCEKYGRAADVESIRIDNGLMIFKTTWGPPNGYNSSKHWTFVVPVRNRIYTWTWNHLMAIFMNVKAGDYRREEDYKILKGTRDDAEEYAKKASEETCRKALGTQ